MKKLIFVLVTLGLCMGSLPASAKIQEHILFNGSNTDTTDLVSPWFPVFGASRVAIRTWSGKVAFHASTDADSTFSDSLTTFKIVVTDSVPVNYKAAAETLLIDPAVATTDTTKAWLMFSRLPINRELRGTANGSGLITVIEPPITNSAGAFTSNPGGIIYKKYMRIIATPLRRMTVTGFSSTAGKRVTGLRKFRMRAYVVYE